MRLLRLVHLTLALATLSACGIDGSTTPAGAVIAGNYRLATIDGQALPWIRPGSTPQTSVVSGTLQVQKDGSFTDTRVTRTVSTGATQTIETTGNFTIGGSVLGYTRSDGTMGVGSVRIAGASIGISVEWTGGNFAYQSQ
jgi:hypothetical protein